MKRAVRHRGYFKYRDKQVKYSFWSNLADGQKPDVVILLGAGQTDAIARRVAESAGTGAIVIGGVPHWHADPSAEDIADFTKSYFKQAYLQILATFNVVSMHIIAESQAAPVAIILAGQLKRVSNLALIRPLGFSVRAFGDTTEARLKTFRKRIARTMLQYPQSFLYDLRNLLVSAVLIRAIIREGSLTSLSRKYAAGISYDSLSDFQQAAVARHKAGNTVSVILGEKDKMFPAQEIITALDTLHIPNVRVITMPSVSHSSLVTRAGKKALLVALETVRS